MAWFRYGKPRRRQWRKGVVVRQHSLSPEIRRLAKRLSGCREPVFGLVLVKEIRPDGLVLLEFQTQKSGDVIEIDGKVYCRYTLFHIETAKDPMWVCEADIGRGMVERRQ